MAASAFAVPLSSTAALADQGLEAQAAGPSAPVPEMGSELENSVGSEAATGVTPQAVVKSGCILPFFKVSYGISLTGKGVFRFVTVPKTKGFNVVMTLNFPGLFRKVNNKGLGGTEAINVSKNFWPGSTARSRSRAWAAPTAASCSRSRPSAGVPGAGPNRRSPRRRAAAGHSRW